MQINEIDQIHHCLIQVFDGNNGQPLDMYQINDWIDIENTGFICQSKIPYIKRAEQGYILGILDYETKNAQPIYQGANSVIRCAALSPSSNRVALIERDKLLILEHLSSSSN